MDQNLYLVCCATIIEHSICHYLLKNSPNHNSTEIIINNHRNCPRLIILQFISLLTDGSTNSSCAVVRWQQRSSIIIINHRQSIIITVQEAEQAPDPIWVWPHKAYVSKNHRQELKCILLQDYKPALPKQKINITRFVILRYVLVGGYMRCEILNDSEVDVEDEGMLNLFTSQHDVTTQKTNIERKVGCVNSVLISFLLLFSYARLCISLC